MSAHCKSWAQQTWSESPITHALQWVVTSRRWEIITVFHETTVQPSLQTVFTSDLTRTVFLFRVFHITSTHLVFPRIISRTHKELVISSRYPNSNLADTSILEDVTPRDNNLMTTALFRNYWNITTLLRDASQTVMNTTQRENLYIKNSILRKKHQQ